MTGLKKQICFNYHQQYHSDRQVLTGLKKQICFNYEAQQDLLQWVLTGLKKQICFNLQALLTVVHCSFDRTEKADLF